MILLISLCSFSCSKRDVRNLLCDVDSYIIDRPDSALAVLDSIDRYKLISRSLKAHHALLYSMALDKNYIDITDDSIARIAVDYYTRLRGNNKAKARSLYSLGRVNFNCGKYDEAILSYIKAEPYAEHDDSLYLGMLKFAMRDAYNKTYNAVEELKCAQEAYQIFTDLGHDRYKRSAEYALAVAYHNLDDFENAQLRYQSIIASSASKDYIWAASMSGYVLSSLMIYGNNADFIHLDECLAQVCSFYPQALQDNDFWMWAYVKFAAGDKINGDLIVDSLRENFVSSASSYWRYLIAENQGDMSVANDFLIQTVRMQSQEVETVLKESLAMSQRDYYKTKLESSEHKLTIKNMMIIICVLIIVVFFMSAWLVLKKAKIDRMRALESAENMLHLLEVSDAEYSQLKNKFVTVYKSKFKTLGQLCSQYYNSIDRIDKKDILYRKVSMMVEEVRNDRVRRNEFENMLNADLNDIMLHLRAEMPKLKEVDYALFCYIATGFDAMTISHLLDMDIKNVYAHKRRLRIKIEDKHPIHMMQFLEMITS